MKVLHLLKTEPCDLVERFVETLFDKEKSSVRKLYEADIDWDAVVDDIFLTRKSSAGGKRGITMKNTLGILISSDKYMDYIINLTNAAYAKGKSVRIFFTGSAVLLTQSPEFEKLLGKAKISVCEVSFRAKGLTGDVPGLGFKDFVTQAKNAEMLAECERYVVF